MTKILTALIAIISFSVFAQPKKGMLYLGGTINFVQNSSEYEQGPSVKATSIGFSPTFGYWIDRSWLTGIRLDFDYSTTQQDGSSNSSTRYTYGSEVFGRYNFYVNEKLIFFPELNTGVNTTEIKQLNNGRTVNKTTYASGQIGVGAGFAFYPIPRLGLEFLIGGVSYGWTENKNNQGSSNSKNFALSLNNAGLNVGITYLIPTGDKQ